MSRQRQGDRVSPLLLFIYEVSAFIFKSCLLGFAAVVGCTGTPAIKARDKASKCLLLSLQSPPDFKPQQRHPNRGRPFSLECLRSNTSSSKVAATATPTAAVTTAATAAAAAVTAATSAAVLLLKGVSLCVLLSPRDQTARGQRRQAGRTGGDT